LITLSQTYWLFQKHVAELKSISQCLFISFMAFIIILCGLSIFYRSPQKDQKSGSGESIFNKNATYEEKKYSIEALIGAYGFMAIIFSLYNSLKFRTQAYMAKSVATGLTLVTVLYFLVVISSISLFGHDLIDAKADLMNNIDAMYKKTGGS